MPVRFLGIEYVGALEAAVARSISADYLDHATALSVARCSEGSSDLRALFSISGGFSTSPEGLDPTTPGIVHRGSPVEAAPRRGSR
jgi:hypothetical protein